MQRCWLPNKDDRPDFDAILRELKGLRDTELFHKASASTSSSSSSSGSGSTSYRRDMKRYFRVLKRKEELSQQPPRAAHRQRKKGGGAVGAVASPPPAAAATEPLSCTGPKNCRSGLAPPNTSRSSRSAEPGSSSAGGSFASRKERVLRRTLVSSVNSSNASRGRLNKAAQGLQWVLQQTLGITCHL